jgi:hypothetical protein
MSSLMDDLKIGSSSKIEGAFLSSVPRVSGLRQIPCLVCLANSTRISLA